MIGEALGNYKVTAKLGSGTMGVVFRAEHVRIARTAAIKVLNPELAQNAGVIQRFFTEARATSLRIATNRVYLDASRPSHIILPIIPRLAR